MRVTISVRSCACLDCASDLDIHLLETVWKESTAETCIPYRYKQQRFPSCSKPGRSFQPHK